MSTKITFYSLRHAQTLDNVAKVFTGWRNPELTTEGYAQASRLNLQGYTIISSPFTRCIETVKLGGGVEYDLDCRLREVCLGQLEGQSYQDIPEYKTNPLDLTPIAGESYRLAYYRIAALLFELFYRLQVKPETKYLLCTSSGIIRILKALEKKPMLEDFHSLKTANCELTTHCLGLQDFYYMTKL